MIIYYIIGILVLLFGLLEKHNYISKKAYCILIGLILFLVAAMRDSSVGSDTANYKTIFEIAVSGNLSLLQSIVPDAGYVLYMKLLASITNNFQIVMIIAALLFSYSISRLIYRYSEDPMLSYLALIAFNIYQASLCIMRQTYAMSFIILALDILINEEKTKKKNVLAFLYIAIASAFHISSLVFIAIYILMYVYKSKRAGKAFIICSGLVIAGTILFAKSIGEKLSYFISDRGFKITSSTGGETTLILLVFLFIAGLAVISQYKNMFKSYSVDYGMVIGATFFQALVPVQNVFFRLGFYFLLIMPIYLPRLIKSFKTVKIQRVSNAFIYIAFMIYYFFFTATSAGVYKFMWQ